MTTTSIDPAVIESDVTVTIDPAKVAAMSTDDVDAIGKIIGQVTTAIGTAIGIVLDAHGADIENTDGVTITIATSATGGATFG